MLTRKQSELLTYIQARLGESGVSPSFEEMKEALALKSKSGVHRLISALEERGFIRRLPNRARALEILRMPDSQAGVAASAKAPVASPQAANDVIDLPLHGRIAAGMPIEALEGQIAPMECFHETPEGKVLCSHEDDGDHACATKLLWTRVQGGVTKALAGTTLAELVEFANPAERDKPLASVGGAA